MDKKEEDQDNRVMLSGGGILVLMVPAHVMDADSGLHVSL